MLKSIAIGNILQSKTMLLLPENPSFGKNIAMRFCKFFSENIEDYRLHGDRSLPMKDFFDTEKKLDPEIFYHTVLHFLDGYMKFENNFTRYRSIDTESDSLSVNVILSSHEEYYTDENPQFVSQVSSILFEE